MKLLFFNKLCITLNPTPIWIESNFKKKILSGQKIHAIKQDQENSWSLFEPIEFCEINKPEFMKGICKGIQDIKIDDKNIFIEGCRLNKKQIELLSKNDGFDCIEHFFTYFQGRYEGKIIHWTEFKYFKNNK